MGGDAYYLECACPIAPTSLTVWVLMCGTQVGTSSCRSSSLTYDHPARDTSLELARCIMTSPCTQRADVPHWRSLLLSADYCLLIFFLVAFFAAVVKYCNTAVVPRPQHHDDDNNHEDTAVWCTTVSSSLRSMSSVIW